MVAHLTTHEEKLLAEQAKTDEEAFSKLYDQYFPLIFAFITRRINDRDEAEDIVSNIFLKVVENIHRYNGEKSSFKTWLYTIATRTLIDHFRKNVKRRTEKIELAEDIESKKANPHEEAKTSEEKEKVLTIINQLPQKHQNVLLLKYCSDLSVDEIAEALGVTNNNVSVMSNRALKAFHNIYSHYA